MATPEPDQRSPERRLRDEQIAAEAQLSPPSCRPMRPRRRWRPTSAGITGAPWLWRVSWRMDWYVPSIPQSSCPNTRGLSSWRLKDHDCGRFDPFPRTRRSGLRGSPPCLTQTRSGSPSSPSGPVARPSSRRITCSRCWPALPPITDPNVFVGHATADDAAVYRISDDLALILTTDFFTPIVDRPYDFGAVAAANALSDVYAMAGTPLAALSLVGFPSGALPPEVLAEILRGAIDKAREAGIAIVGGHTIQTDEPIFGLAVVGRVDPREVITNAGAQPGDFLVLTKPLGLGIITTAAKRDEDPRAPIAEAIAVMTTLNRDAVRRDGRGRRACADRRDRFRSPRTSPKPGRRQRRLGDDLERPRTGPASRAGVRAERHRTRRHSRQPSVPGTMGRRMLPRHQRLGAAPALRRPDLGGPARRVARNSRRRGRPDAARPWAARRPSSARSIPVSRVESTSVGRHNPGTAIPDLTVRPRTRDVSGSRADPARRPRGWSPASRPRCRR